MLIHKLLQNNCSGCRCFVKFFNNIEKYLHFSHAIITIGYKFSNVKKYQFSMSEIILYMYKGVIIHQLSSLNICFTTFINKNGLSTCSPHYSSPCSPFHTFHNFQKLQKSHFLFSFRFRFLWSQQSFLSI